MIQEALAYLTGLATRKRPAMLKLEDGSGDVMIYDDAKKQYEARPRFVKRERSVSNVESFARMVIEEARRAGCSGDWMTVVFNQSGGRFYLNDKDGRTVFTYARELAPQWQLLVGAHGRGHAHADFVRLLQQLKPSIVDYSTVMMQFRKVTFGQSTEVDSAPTLVEGASGSAYAVRAKVGSAVSQASLPGEIKFALQFTRSSSMKYESEVEVDVQLNEAKKTLTFTLLFTDRPALEERALTDEAAWFKSEVGPKLPQLSILEDY